MYTYTNEYFCMLISDLDAVRNASHSQLCTFMYTHTYKHTYIHTYIHIQMNTCVCWFLVCMQGEMQVIRSKKRVDSLLQKDRWPTWSCWKRICIYIYIYIYIYISTYVVCYRGVLCIRVGKVTWAILNATIHKREINTLTNTCEFGEIVYKHTQSE